MSDWTTKPALWSDKHEIVEKDAQGFDIIIGRICAQEDARRIVAEHNILAGIPDPAAAIAAAREVLAQAAGAGCFNTGARPGCHCISCRAKVTLSLLERKP